MPLRDSPGRSQFHESKTNFISCLQNANDFLGKFHALSYQIEGGRD